MRSRDDATRGRSDGVTSCDDVTVSPRDGVTSCDDVTVSPRDGVTSDIIGQPFRAAGVFQTRVGVGRLAFVEPPASIPFERVPRSYPPGPAHKKPLDGVAADGRARAGLKAPQP